MEDEQEDEREPPWGVVLVAGRGVLPFTLVHGESFVAAASWALGASGVELLDHDVTWDRVRESGRGVVLHDSSCPLTTVEFLEQAVGEADASGAVVVGTRPVTDTVKEYDEPVLGATVDREDLVCVTSPVVLPAAVVASLTELDVADLEAVDLATLVADLAARFPLRFLQAPASGRRVAGDGDLEVLQALSPASR